jgi:uncharacterized repeat protein (TIGR01451 family)
MWRLPFGLLTFVVTFLFLPAAAVYAQTITPIHDVQGPGASSPIVGAVVTIRGIVTGVTANGFFVQDDEANYDADPATSEAIFVLTSGAPTVAFTARVEVTGTVTEFVPASDVLQPPSTQLTFPTVVQLAPAGQPLPAPVPLSAMFPDPAGPFDQLERVEHMRVSVASLTVTGPSGGTVDESTATGASDGLFQGVLTGIVRPFREPGIQSPDPPPSGTIPPIPRWDFNPERIGVASAAITGQPVLTVKSGDTLGLLVGPLDYASRTYTVLPDGTSTATIVPGSLPTTTSVAAGNEVTVASVNLRRFFDTTDDPSVADVVVAPAAYDRRLAKASIAIRNHLRNPDIVGIQEVETLGVLIDLAARILADGGPQYDVILAPGNDAAGLDVGFLFKIDVVPGGVPRVSNTSGTQVNASELWIDPATGAPALLHDRPSLVLEATISRTSAASFPIVVMVSDLLGLGGIDSFTAAGSTTVGDRVRRKRQAQAVSLANYVQGRQIANPAEHLVVIGSHNAFEFNDGHVDVMNVIAGTPAPDNQTSVPGDGVDLVNPDLVNLVTTPAPAGRYSDVFDGTARNLDHALVNAALVAATSARRIEHPRIAADYPETELGNNATALRFSDRDPVLTYLAAPALNLADVSITKVGSPNPVIVGQNVTYTITVTNNGPDAGAAVALLDTLPPATTFVSLSSPGGWSCTTPAVGAGGTLSCSIASSSVGSAVFTLVVGVPPTATAGTIVSNTATVSAITADPVPGNNSATASTTIAGTADLSITKTGPATVVRGGSIAYTLTVVNAGPSSATGVTIADPTPPGLTFVSTSGACVSTFPCALGTLASGESRVVTATFRVPPGYSGANPIVNVATVSASTLDAVLTNNSGSAGTLVSNTGSGCDVNGDGRLEFITGAGTGGGPHVRIWSVEGGTPTELAGAGFFAYDPAFSGGVRLACRDVTGDGIAELITGAGPGGGPHVRVWSVTGNTLSELTGFFAYDPAFAGGVTLAAGDLTGDGVGELITGAGSGGGPHVRVWNVAGGVSELTGFFAYDPAFAGGVNVAVGDLTGDGVGELITGAGSGGGPHVRVWNVAGGVSELTGFFAYDPAFAGGVTVAAGDVTGDGVAELITGAGPGGGPHVRVWSLTGGGPIEIAGFFPYDPAFAGGVAVAVGDVTGDGVAELITGAGPGGGPHVRVWSLTGAGFVEVAGFFAYDPAFAGGVFVAR